MGMPHGGGSKSIGRLIDHLAGDSSSSSSDSSEEDAAIHASTGLNGRSGGSSTDDRVYTKGELNKDGKRSSKSKNSSSTDENKKSRSNSSGKHKCNKASSADDDGC